MRETEFLTTEQKLVRLIVLEIWMLANAVYNRKQLIKSLDRLAAASYLLNKSLIANGDHSGSGESPPIYLVIERELDEIRSS